MQRFYEEVIGLEVMRRFAKTVFFRVANGLRSDVSPPFFHPFSLFCAAEVDRCILICFNYSHNLCSYLLKKAEALR